MEKKTMPKTIRRATHIEQKDFLEDAAVRWVGYTAANRPVLTEAVGLGAQRAYWQYANKRETASGSPFHMVIRQSQDNGKTWRKTGDWPCFQPLADNRTLVIGEPNYVLEPRTGRLLRLYRTSEQIVGLRAWDAGSPERTTGRVWTQFSNDEGQTWTTPRPLITQGAEYDETHWAPGVWHGKNSGVIENVIPLVLADGRFLLPFRASIWSGPGDPMNYRFKCGALIGRWQTNGEVEWRVTAYATVYCPFSFYGGVEPALATLDDGRLVMTMRAHMGGPSDLSPISNARWFVTSADLGQTWSEPQVLRYETGEPVYNPACLADIFRSSETGGLYLITNYADRPCYNGLPRHTLQIARVRPETFRVIRESMTIIETRDEAAGQPETICFSNWARYEDRDSKHTVLFLTGDPGESGRHETCGVPPHSYRYEIDFANFGKLQ